ncbi:Prostaglandin E2 receptor EP2 subtype [Dissostichus eleginoides]|uniref:Prostaglandin E2 receptor EP2 subtype n=1 Tax=Dissostichus eleginoides TaxID=100907 RepID=A0AAD9BS86_DISEL|nr:Prostaglandin E2 receptor EP2 subtype [Dissostichus eleginoides]
MANSSSNDSKCHDMVNVESGQPITSALMFAGGVVGNIVVLVLLEVRRRRPARPCTTSCLCPGKTLVGMNASRELCAYFGFSMTFLSLSTLSIVNVIALERYLSIGQPYFYERHLSKLRGYITVALIYLGSILFCIAPFLGFGDYVQYCPGTWCFLEMSHKKEGKDQVYIGLYASFILIVITSTVFCNISVIFHLVMMQRKRKARRSGEYARSRYRRSLSMSEEVEHLLPLAIITVVFICCTFPLVLRVYINFTGNHTDTDTGTRNAELRALRLLSFHSIINPWVFIIPSIVRVIWRKSRKPQKSSMIWGKTKTTVTGGRPCCAVTEPPK